MKAKTHKSHTKRFSITASGKIMHKTSGVSHLRVNKSPRKTGFVELASVDCKRIRRVLPNSF